MFYGIMMACMVASCSPEQVVYKKEYGPFATSNECVANSGKALRETPPNYRYNPHYTCMKK